MTAAKRYLFGVAVVAAALLIRVPLYPILGSNRPYLVLFGAIALVAWMARWKAAALAAVTGFIIANLTLVAHDQPFSFDARFFIELLIYGLSSGLIIYFGEAMHRARDRVERQNDLLRITLASIGDGVIVTDADGRVQSLNAEAERLMGWSSADARGRALSDVFPIVNEETGQPVESPVDKVLRTRTVVGLANHTVLISRSGTRIPIDDSAAPIRTADGRSVGVVMVFRDVSAQRAAQRAQSQLAAIVRYSGDAIATKDLNGVVQTWNAGAEALFGYRAEEIVGKPIMLLIPAERAHEETEILSSLRAGRPVERLETVRMTQDGRRIQVALSISPIFDPHGEIIGVSKIARDISEMVAAREALAREKKLLSTTLASIGDAVIVTDAQGCVTFLNPEAERLTGWAHVDATGRTLPTVFRILNENTRAPVENPVEKVLRLGVVVGLANHTILVAKDGTELPIDDSAAPIRDADGTLYGVVLVFRDFSERRLVEANLRTSEARFRAMANAAPVLIWESGVDKLCTWFNERWLQFVGRAMEQEVGNGWAENVHPDDFESCLRTYVDAFDAREPFAMTYRLKRHDGQYRWILDNGAPRYGAEGTFEGYIGSCVDITDRIIAEEALRDADRRKDEFLALLSHELRNPLAPIRTAVGLLDKHGSSQQKTRELHEIIARQTLHLTRLLDDLLDVSRIASGKIVLRKKRIDLADALAQAVESVRPDLDAHGHELAVSVPLDPVWIHGDMTRMSQVIVNLLSNASKFTPSPGRIELALEREGSDALIRVRDTGIGISQDQMPRIFEMFVQLRPALEVGQSGLGVGLALAKTLVELHKGRIDAVSKGAGKGSEFIVRLPVSLDEPPAGVKTEEMPVTAIRARRVLIADDYVDSAEVLAAALRDFGHDVVTAYDGLATLAAADSHKPDVAILDIGMPKMNGLEVARILRERFAHITLIAVTGWGQESDRQRAMQAGFNHHLTKPVDVLAINRFLHETHASIDGRQQSKR